MGGLFGQSFKMSIKNIRSNKMRSFLTMLGIIIGVGAVIALITIVQGVTDSIMNEFTGLGAGTISVSAPGTALKSGLTEADLETLKNVPGVKAVNPTVSVMTSAVADGEVYDKVSIDGESAVYFPQQLLISAGLRRIFDSVRKNLIGYDNHTGALRLNMPDTIQNMMTQFLRGMPGAITFR